MPSHAQVQKSKAIPALLASSTGKNKELNLHISIMEGPERRKRAFKTLGLFVLLSLVSAPLPPIHWLTVPGFLLLGLYRFSQILQTPQILPSQELPCPECEKNFSLKEQYYQDFLALSCPNCGYNLQLKS